MKNSVMKTGLMLTVVALLIFFTASPAPGAEEFSPRSDGFIRDWLVLSPIQLESDADGGVAIEKNQIPDEGNLKPKANDKVTIAGKEFTWQKVKASEYYVDLNELAKQPTEKTVAYAVCYVRAEAERKDLQLKMGSNDQGKVYLNGKVLLKTSEPRGLNQDDDVARNVTLNRGMNVVVFKVFNEGGSDWQGCLRFAEANGKVVTNLVIRLEP